jgi:hypothetical protein
MRLRVVAIVATAFVGPSALEAQRVVSSLDLSGTNVWYGDSVQSGGASFSPSLRIDWPRATLSGAANVSRLAGAGMSVQGMMAPSVFSPSVGPFTGELTGSLGGSTHQDGSRTGQAIGLVRAYATGAGAGVWAGAGGGRTWDGVVWRGVRQGEFGAWVQNAGMTLLATVAPVVVQDTIKYTDIQGAWRLPVASYELGATAGVRAGTVGAAVGGSSRVWASGSAVAWLTSGLAIVASGGSYPVDFTQGYPGGHFVSVALRVASRPARKESRSATPPLDALAEAATTTLAAGATAFEVRASPTGGPRELRIRAASARSVEVNGDFTQWQPVSLVRADDGWWTITQAIAPGTYQINLRIDGGAWLAPPGLLTTKDEFGGIVGILTIE